jgi:predicted AlkP superfamily pyrophosphatase or phosphodiesterase
MKTFFAESAKTACQMRTVFPTLASPIKTTLIVGREGSTGL